MYLSLLFFFFNDTATTEIYTLSLHDALPISTGTYDFETNAGSIDMTLTGSPSFHLNATSDGNWAIDRKSTRLNSSHTVISYAVFCLKKKKKKRKRKNRKT